MKANVPLIRHIFDPPGNEKRLHGKMSDEFHFRLYHIIISTTSSTPSVFILFPLQAIKCVTNIPKVDLHQAHFRILNVYNVDPNIPIVLEVNVYTCNKLVRKMLFLLQLVLSWERIKCAITLKKVLLVSTFRYCVNYAGHMYCKLKWRIKHLLILSSNVEFATLL